MCVLASQLLKRAMAARTYFFRMHWQCNQILRGVFVFSNVFFCIIDLYSICVHFSAPVVLSQKKNNNVDRIFMLHNKKYCFVLKLETKNLLCCEIIDFVLKLVFCSVGKAIIPLITNYFIINLKSYVILNTCRFERIT